MLYTDVASVRKAMNKLSPKVTDSDIEIYIQKASDYLDAMLGGTFQTPLVGYAPIVKHIATDLTVFFFAEDVFSSQQPNLDEYAQSRYDRVMSTVQKILSGELSIGIEPIDPATGSGFASTNDSDPIFTTEEPYW